MAIFLHRVGRLAFRQRWYVALVRAAVLAFAGLSALKAPEASDKGFSMPGIESQKSIDLMEQGFPGRAADGATARIVFVAPSGERITGPGNKQAALIGVAVSMVSVPALAHALDLSSTTSILAMMLGLAIGIDYALFVFSRCREEHARGHRPVPHLRQPLLFCRGRRVG